MAYSRYSISERVFKIRCGGRAIRCGCRVQRISILKINHQIISVPQKKNREKKLERILYTIISTIYISKYI